jgi:hypothetical protein
MREGGDMSTRGLFVFGVIGVLSIVAFPALAQRGMGPRWWNGRQVGTAQPLSMPQAEEIARQTIAQSGFQGLVPMHIMAFSNNFYVAVRSKRRARGRSNC